MLNLPLNGKIQGLFKVFECFQVLFMASLIFNGLFKTVLYIQVLFKSVQTLFERVKGHLEILHVLGDMSKSHLHALLSEM